MRIFISPLIYQGINFKLFPENKNIFLHNHSTGLYARKLTWKYHHYQILRPCLCSPVLLKMSVTVIRSSHFAINCQVVFFSFHLKQFIGTFLSFMHDLDSKQENRTIILKKSLESSVVAGSSFQNWVLPMVTQKCCSLQCMASGGSQFWFVLSPVMLHHKLR